MAPPGEAQRSHSLRQSRTTAALTPIVGLTALTEGPGVANDAVTPEQAISDEKALTRALSYPYERIASEFLFEDGVEKPLPEDYVPPRDEHIVLAIGSNMAPSQLARKFGRTKRIALIRAVVHGVDVVFSSLMSSYGAFPATLARSAGTTVEMLATVLDSATLKDMNRTELGYNLLRLRPRHVSIARAPARPVLVYVAARGAMVVRTGMPGRPTRVALSEVVARGRVLPSMTQAQLQRAVLDSVAPGCPVERLVLAAAHEEGLSIRRSVIEAISEAEEPDGDFGFCFETAVACLGTDQVESAISRRHC